MPKGARPKRTVVCPNPPPRSYLIGGHRYLFKHPSGRTAQQIWSEVIAYKLAREVGVDVPPAFLACDSATAEAGVLIEYFYGPPGRRDVRFVHAVDRFQAHAISFDEKAGALTNNIAVSRMQGAPDWRGWWARTLAFDTLIGNTDRHSENWGFLVDWQAGSRPTYELAPAFDNGSSLGCAIRDEDLIRYHEPDRFKRFLGRGHHYSWRDRDDTPGGHAALCGNLSGDMAKLPRSWVGSRPYPI
ncbi:HipA domain-containing protein [Dankookia sp. P2]|uniref:HipA domain-containing protein n=1 Tax=Dankookia sp. P2 TaxID=3423955 RepID=UPI003D66B6FF